MTWSDRFSLAGRKAMVTGASKGIGAAIARLFAEAGADIVAVGRDAADLAETADAVRAEGRRCLVIEAELADEGAPVAAGQRALDEWGTIDILVNNAGIAVVAPALDTTLDEWDRVMAVNLRAPFLLARTLAPAMIAQRWGKIVNISSQTGVIALDDHAAYAASKGGLNALTKSLACEWAKHNVQVNAICPTVIMTPMGRTVWGAPERGGPMLEKIPLRRFGEVTEVADAALYLASPAAELVNGDLLMLDGGYTAL
jgi:NAD(P)-dependent dehydrogenase (short-subunit alcohol dehydrogenase family)